MGFDLSSAINLFSISLSYLEIIENDSISKSGRKEPDTYNTSTTISGDIKYLSVEEINRYPEGYLTTGSAMLSVPHTTSLVLNSKIIHGSNTFVIIELIKDYEDMGNFREYLLRKLTND